MGPNEKRRSWIFYRWCDTLKESIFNFFWLTLNLSKTKYINFVSARKSNGTCNNISVSIVLNTWACRWTAACRSATGAIGAISRLKFLPTNTLVNIYYTLIHSHLNYTASIGTIKTRYQLDEQYSNELLFTESWSIVYSVLHNAARSNLRLRYENRQSSRHGPNLVALRKRRVWVICSVYVLQRSEWVQRAEWGLEKRPVPQCFQDLTVLNVFKICNNSENV